MLSRALGQTLRDVEGSHHALQAKAKARDLIDGLGQPRDQPRDQRRDQRQGDDTRASILNSIWVAMPTEITIQMLETLASPPHQTTLHRTAASVTTNRKLQRNGLSDY